MRISMQNRGIGNRMMSWCQSYRLDSDVKVYWEENYFVGCKFHDLFENDIEVKSLDGITADKIHGSWRFVTRPEDNCPRRIDYLYGQTPQNMLDLNIKLMKKMIPIRYIRDEIAEWKNRFKPNTWLAAIRSWPGTDRTFKINEAFKEIDAIPSDDIFLTCDHFDVAGKIIQRYKGRVWYRPKRQNWGDRHNATGVQDCLIDMYLGGFAMNQLLSWHSTFCQFQWFFSDCKAKYKEICQFEKKSVRGEPYYPEHIKKMNMTNDGGKHV